MAKKPTVKALKAKEAKLETTKTKTAAESALEKRIGKMTKNLSRMPLALAMGRFSGKSYKGKR